MESDVNERYETEMNATGVEGDCSRVASLGTIGRVTVAPFKIYLFGR